MVRGKLPIQQSYIETWITNPNRHSIKRPAHPAITVFDPDSLKLTEVCGIKEIPSTD